jgi:L-serine dehydratase
VQLGLCGEDPVTFNVDQIIPRINDIAAMKKIILNGRHEVGFDSHEDIDFLITESLPYHSNALSFLVSFSNGDTLAETYYSIGGGFVKKEGEITKKDSIALPFPINTAADLMHWCMKTGLAIHEVVLENENAWRIDKETREGVLNIWQVMKECTYRG